jgi:hypothetical protein
MAPPDTSTLRSPGDLSDFKGAGSPTLARRFIPILRPRNRVLTKWRVRIGPHSLRHACCVTSCGGEVLAQGSWGSSRTPQCLWYAQLTKFDLNGLRGVANFGLGVFSRSCLVCIGSGDVDNLKYELGSFPVGAV